MPINARSGERRWDGSLDQEDDRENKGKRADLRVI